MSSDLKMRLQFLTNLPSEIIIDILSRLPVRTIISCKCVCKAMLGLVQTREFAQSHLPKSIPGLAVFKYERKSMLYKIFKFVDGIDFERDELYFNLITSFNLPFCGLMVGSASGLLLLRDISAEPEGLYICNPITRDYIQLHCPQEFVYIFPQEVTYGFGTSKMTGQHKVVRICYNRKFDEKTSAWIRASEDECQVYSLGTRSWRRIAPGDGLGNYRSGEGTFVNGNIYWLVHNSEGSQWISCFDLETELFCTSSIPFSPRNRHPLDKDMYVLGNCLCLCDNTSNDRIVVWLMKEYGVEKSWTKEFVISIAPDYAREYYEMSEIRNYTCMYNDVYPIKVFEDGDILMSWADLFLFCYSTKTGATKKVDMLSMCSGLALYSPSFLSLHNFEKENVLSF